MNEEICKTLSAVVHQREEILDDVWITPYEFRESRTGNQFVIFLKPEVTTSENGVRVRDITEIVLNELARWEIQIGAIRILSSRYLREHSIMDRHYGVINKVSREGISAISDDARASLENIFERELRLGVPVLGGHQFLNRFPSFSAFALSTISDNIGTKKLSSGVYCIPLRVSGETILILNAFHPFQLESYTSDGKAIVVIEARAAASWTVLREQLAGATNPVNAAQGSIRRILLDKKDDLGLVEVSQGMNGIHLSAGPLEGMVEVHRFFSRNTPSGKIDLRQTCFGRLLLDKGLSEKLVAELSENPYLRYRERMVSAFDLTEELDANRAAEKLIEAIKPH